MVFRALIISAHGVSTAGAWQEDVVTPAFEGIEGLVHRPHKYGWFAVWKILWPRARRREVERFAEFYDQLCRDNAVRPSVIAHSFGTYIVTTALKRHPVMKFDRLILCGSIVAKDFPWRALLGVKVAAVRNEIAGEDWVVKLFRWRIARWLVPGAGPSGVEGFTDPPAAVRSTASIYTHSEFFLVKKHCNRYWRPFIRNLEQFTELCYACAENQTGAWKRFEHEQTPIIRQTVAIMFPGENEDALSKRTDAIVVMVAAGGCTGAHDAETLAIAFCREIKATMRSRAT